HAGGVVARGAGRGLNVRYRLLPPRCALRPARPFAPPLIVKSACCAFEALVVSMIELQAVPPLCTSVTYDPFLRLPCRKPLAVSTYRHRSRLPKGGDTNCVNCAMAHGRAFTL